MKNLILLAVTGILFSVSVNAQSTVDSIESKYKLLPMPQGYSIEKAFPVLGTYQLNSTGYGAANGNVTITLDSSNKGVVWVDGLPEGRLKAHLRKSPSTYRITAQKTSTGREIPEGTMIFNPDNNTLNIALGTPYNETDPAAIFAQSAVTGTETVTTNTDQPVTTGKSTAKLKTKTGNTKTKTRVLYYTAIKNQNQSNGSTTSLQ